MALSPTGDGEIPDGPEATGTKPQPQAEAIEQLTGLASEDLGALISDAFEKHLPDPSVLVEPAQAYANQLTEATLEKLSPLTNLVRDSVEGVAEARLSLQDQADVIRGSMDGLSQELNQSLQAMEPVLRRLEQLSTSTYTETERMDQVQALVELRRSIETLNASVARLEPARRRWFGRG